MVLCGFGYKLRLTNLTQTPIDPQTIAAISNDTTTDTVNPTPVIIILVEINAVSTTPAILIPRLCFLDNAFLIDSLFYSLFLYFGNNQ